MGLLEHFLLLLGSGDFITQFPNRLFASIDNLKAAAKECSLVSFLENKPSRFQASSDRLEKIISEMHVGFLNYEGLTQFLSRATPPDADQSDGAYVYRKLIDGLRKEISVRELA